MMRDDDRIADGGDRTRARRAVAAAFGGNALDNFDFALFTLMMPVLGALWSMGRAQAGLIATVAIATGAIGGVVAGVAADRWGRARVLQLTILAFSACTFLCGFAPGPNALLVLRALQGFGFGGELAVGAVLVGEWVSPARRGRIMGLVASGFAIGSLVAFGAFVLASALLPRDYAWRATFWLGLLPAALIFYVRRYVEDAPRDRVEPRSARGGVTPLFAPALRWRTVLATMLVMGITGAQNCFVIWLPTFLQAERGFSFAATGANYIANSLGAIIGFLFGGLVSDRLGRRRGFAVSVLVALSALTAYLFAPLGGVALAPLAGIVGLLIVAAGVAITPYLVELFPAEVRATGTGFCYSVGRGTGAIFPALVGVFGMRYPLPWAMWGMIALAYALVLTAIALLPETQVRFAARQLSLGRSRTSNAGCQAAAEG